MYCYFCSITLPQHTGVKDLVTGTNMLPNAVICCEHVNDK